MPGAAACGSCLHDRVSVHHPSPELIRLQMKLAVLVAAALLSTAVIVNGMFQRYQLVAQGGTGIVVRVDRLTGATAACLPTEVAGSLIFRCDGRIPE
jgi:hypothetical protein